MPGPWFLLLVFVQAGDLMTGISADVWMDDAPTCEELRSLWSSISRSERTSEFTNEIPLMPWDVFSSYPPPGIHHSKLDKGRRKNGLPKTSLITNAFQNMFMEDKEGPPSVHPLPPSEPLLAPSPHSQQTNAPMPGPFGPFSGGSSRPGAFFLDPLGTRKKGGSDSESWGLPEEVGLFGRFLDFDDDFPLTNSRERQGWPAESAHFGSPSLDVMQETCLQILNRDCTVNEQCACIGWNTLKCIRGKCNSLQQQTGKENEHGSWHHGPLPHSKLGRQKRLRRNNKYTIM